MNTNDTILIKRFEELSLRSFNRSCYTSSDFLSLAEQDVLTRLKNVNNYELLGGYDGAERRLAFFGNENDCGYEDSPPISIIRIAPSSKKFAQELSHRDFLGSLMALGIKREVMGDIVIKENEAYLFCLNSIAPYIMDNLVEVKRTTVSCFLMEELPEIMEQKLEEKDFIVSSERIDALISAVFKLSRSEAQNLFPKNLVFINQKQCLSTSQNLKEDDLISVRGFGRFYYKGIERETKKGRLKLKVNVFN